MVNLQGGVLIWRVVECLIPLPIRQENHEQLCNRCKLNLVNSPHRARCLDLMGRLIESTAMQPVPVPVPVLWKSMEWHSYFITDKNV